MTTNPTARPRPKRANGDGSMIARPDGSLLLRVSLPEGGRRHRTVRAEPGETPAQMRKRAQSLLTELAAERDAGRTTRGAITVAAYADAWLAAERVRLERGRSKRRPATHAHYQRMLTLYVLPGVGTKPLGRLNRTDVERLLDRLADRGLSAGTVRHARVMLSVLCKAAHREGLVALPLPTDHVEMPAIKHQSRPPVVWEPSQVLRLLAELRGERWEGPVALMALLGLRRGEAIGLGWSDVDLDAGTVTISRNLVVVRRQLVLGPTKTAKSRRGLPLDPRLVAVLRRWRAEQAVERLALGSAWGDGWTHADLVFTDPAGRPLSPNALHNRLLRAASAAGLPHVHAHALRHMAGSFAIADGASIFDVADMLGHVNATMILTRYGHSLPGGRERAVAGVAAAVGTW